MTFLQTIWKKGDFLKTLKDFQELQYEKVCVRVFVMLYAYSKYFDHHDFLVNDLFGVIPSSRSVFG